MAKKQDRKTSKQPAQPLKVERAKSMEKAADKTATREKVPILGRYYKSAPNRPQKAGLAKEKVRLLFHSWTAKAKKES